MNHLNELHTIPVFSLEKNKKEIIFNQIINELTCYHYSKCNYYKRMLDILEYEISTEHNLKDIPFIPARLFKLHRLSSIDDNETIKTLTSSGTTGQIRSTIVLDKKNSLNQIKVLSRIVSSLTGQKRVPMLVIDSPSVIKNREMFSARGAGILGFSMLATKVEYALNDDMELDISLIQQFAEKYSKQPVLMFGFTYMIWEYFCKPLLESSQSLNFDKAIVLHGGGWKKMADNAVDNKKFKHTIKQVTGTDQIHDYYGMVEQAGSIYLECKNGHLHTSIYSDVIIRRNDFSICDINEPGIIQVLSLLPTSYPGHSILTEDSGVLLGEGDCSCGRKGKYFSVTGRIKSAEIRGCSDTFSK